MISASDVSHRGVNLAEWIDSMNRMLATIEKKIELLEKTALKFRTELK